MLCKFTINYTKINSHGLINKHEQFILNHSTKHIFTQNYFMSHSCTIHVTIHMNSKTLRLLFTTTQNRNFLTRFKAFETESTAKTSLRTFLTIYMALSQRLTQVGKDLYLVEFDETPRFWCPRVALVAWINFAFSLDENLRSNFHRSEKETKKEIKKKENPLNVSLSMLSLSVRSDLSFILFFLILIFIIIIIII